MRHGTCNKGIKEVVTKASKNGWTKKWLDLWTADITPQKPVYLVDSSVSRGVEESMNF
jgi:hypothetical protein